MRLRPALAVLLLAAAGCDGGAVDDSSFARLQGLWERTDQVEGGGAVRLGPGQDYAFFDGPPSAETAVETGLYGTLSGPDSDDRFTIRYMPDGEAFSFYDEAAVLDGDRLTLRGEGGAARRYRRAE